MGTAAGYSTMYGLFNAQVGQTASAIAIDHEGQTLTYAQLNDRVPRLSAIFSIHGIERDDRIVILSEHRPKYFVAELAREMKGSIFACLNWRLTAA